MCSAADDPTTYDEGWGWFAAQSPQDRLDQAIALRNIAWAHMQKMADLVSVTRMTGGRVNYALYNDAQQVWEHACRDLLREQSRWPRKLTLAELAGTTRRA